jgi:hypothetical protein
MEIMLHDEIITRSLAILPDLGLMFAMILGLNVRFFSGLTIPIFKPSYRLQSNPSLLHPF